MGNKNKNGEIRKNVSSALASNKLRKTVTGKEDITKGIRSGGVALTPPTKRK